MVKSSKPDSKLTEEKEPAKKKGKSGSKAKCTNDLEPPQSEDNVEYWFRSSDEVRSGCLSGNSFDMKPVQYSVLGDMAIFEGDIALGTVEEVERDATLGDPEMLPLNGIAIEGNRFRWPKGTIPYVIDPGLSNPQRVTEAIAHWMELTPIRFVERQEGNPEHQNYISFEELDGCWSQVGMRGGKQIISLGPGCSRGSAIHEIGHAVGLWHEHSRQDRDQYIQILWENILEGREHNFTQHISDGDDIGIYDFASIMHYPALAFTKNGQATIVSKKGETIGQRFGLSEMDIAAVRAMYPRDRPQPQPQPQVRRSGSEVLGSIPPFDSRRWITSNWPIEWNVLWTIIPSPSSVRVEWNVVTERQSDVRLKYYIQIRNLSEIQATVEIRYLVI